MVNTRPSTDHPVVDDLSDAESEEEIFDSSDCRGVIFDPLLAYTPQWYHCKYPVGHIADI